MQAAFSHAAKLTQFVPFRRKSFIGLKHGYVSLAASLPRASRYGDCNKNDGAGGRRDKKIGGCPMDLHTRGAAKPLRSRPQIACAQCGENLFMPEWSELVDERRVRHLWQCDACGYAFETTIRFAEAA
jgi:ribosomal protein S27AE